MYIVYCTYNGAHNLSLKQKCEIENTVKLFLFKSVDTETVNN